MGYGYLPLLVEIVLLSPLKALTQNTMYGVGGKIAYGSKACSRSSTNVWQELNASAFFEAKA
jgi:hypothetical protein